MVPPAFTSLEKVQLIKRHLLEQTPVSKLCEEQGISPVIFHQWMEHFFRNGAQVFEPVGRPGRGRPPKYGPDARLREVERKLEKKDAVLAELLAEHVDLKKKLGLD